MKITNFEQLECWQEARKLNQHIYKLSGGNHFKRDFTLMDQIRRASISIMANIAEGFDRGSNKELIRFLYIAMASASEVKSHLYVALDQGYINKEAFDETYRQATKIGKLINAFISYLRSCEKSGRINAQPANRQTD